VVVSWSGAGFEPILPEWPGVPATVAEAREHPESQAGVGFEQIVDHHAGIVESLPEPPVMIGHSFGGLVVMSLLDRGLGRAGVAIDPAQIRGVVRTPPAQLASAFPVLRNPANRATLAERAQQIGASERTVARLFRDQLGMSWQQWRQQAVLAHALPLLARGMPVSQVAAASGYATDSAFCAMFKAASGQSPTSFQHKKRL